MEKNSLNFRNLKDIVSVMNHRIYPSVWDNILVFRDATSVVPIIQKRP